MYSENRVNLIKEFDEFFIKKYDKIKIVYRGGGIDE